MCCQKFSVAMAVYAKDDPWHFKIAVDSILNQTRRPDEVVLVVDGPVPLSLDEVISAYEAMPLFRVIRLEKNCGHGHARRTGLVHCTHELVALMDADDISRPDRFEKQLARMEADPSLSIVGGNIAEFIGTPDNVVSYRHVETEDAKIKKDLKIRCPMNQVSVLFRRDDVKRAGGYLDFYCEEDYYLWVRMALLHMKFANVPDVLVDVRVGRDMYRRRGGMRYFKSEARLQKFMYKQGLIGTMRYALNVIKRLVVQVLLPNRVRGYIFRKFARTSRAPEGKS
ncbi:MAG: glycosyltransferase [Clostridia bacterium]|nr:glycosyltransferase [Clostridia bacterium]